MDPQITHFLQLLNNPFYAFLYVALMFWSLVWKGIALWRAAGHGQKKWFVAMLVTNTFGILELIYIFYFSKPKEPKI